jgi:hypothetical protein
MAILLIMVRQERAILIANRLVIIVAAALVVMVLQIRLILLNQIAIIAALKILNCLVMIIIIVAAKHPQKTIRTMTAMQVAKERRRAVPKSIAAAEETASLGATLFLAVVTSK